MGNSRKYPYQTRDSFHVLSPSFLWKFQNVPPIPMPSEFHYREPYLPFRISTFFWKDIFDLAMPIWILNMCLLTIWMFNNLAGTPWKLWTGASFFAIHGTGDGSNKKFADGNTPIVNTPLFLRNCSSKNPVLFGNPQSHPRCWYGYFRESPSVCYCLHIC